MFKTKLFGLFLHALLLGSILLTTWNAFNLLNSSSGRFLVKRTYSSIQSELNELALGDVDQAAVEREIDKQLKTEPRNWVLIDSLQEIADKRRYSLSEEISAQLEQARDRDQSYLESASACARCAWDISSCEISKAMICGFAVNMTPIGDIAGVTNAGLSYWGGGEVDVIDALLSVVGLGATALTLGTAGSSLAVKAGAGTLKFAHLSGNIPAPITRVLKKAATEGVDWARLRNVRNADELSSVMRKEALRPAVDAASSIASVVDKTGMQQGLYLLKTSKSPAELQSVKNVAELWEEQTAGYLTLLGRNRVARLTMRYTDEVYGLAMGMLGMAISVFCILLSGAGNAVIRRLNRRAHNAKPSEIA